MSIYLGLDSSTQSLKALLIDAKEGRVIAAESVHFGKDLPGYGCPDGVMENPDPLVKHSPPGMWLAALDLVLERMWKSGAPLAEVRGISGAGQQHGSVYLNAGATAALAGLSPERTLAEQMAGTYSRATSPVWMDSSTSEECAEIQAAVGERLQRDTGSPAIERFTGPQIRRFAKTDPAGYAATERIHLVSSFLCSVLIGKHAPIDTGDGAGMNLLNLREGAWDEEILEATAPGLRAKLPPVEPSCRVAGGLCGYFSRYGLRAGIPVVLWTGDNPSSLVGVGAAQAGVAVISLGTSDTFFAPMDDMKTDPGGCGHVFGNPAGGFMSLICFKNGSLARERVREECGVDWDIFGGSALAETPPGNDGNLMLPYYIPEITPRVLHAGVRLRGSEAFVSGKPGVERVRAVLEGQVCSMKLHSEWIGSFAKVRVTGGASRNNGLVKMIADVFQAEAELISVADSAALGAALRAANAVGGYAWDDLSRKFAAASETVRPDPALAEGYGKCVENYRAFLAEVAGG